MANPRDRILIVESDSVVSDLIGRQTLQAVGYQVQIAVDANAAIGKALQWSPDLILLDLNLPGLSGKDLMVALTAQGVQTPVIVIAPRGVEADIIQAFRLGASDFLLLPVREAEVLNAVNRVLKQVHDRQERERLSRQLEQANQELQARVRELTTIFALGKAMTSATAQSSLMEKILEGAIHTTQADLGWFMLREDADSPFLVVAKHKLPPALGVETGRPWDDGISSLVALSGESLAMHGEPLRRFKVSSLGASILIAPIKMQKKVTGLLVMMRKEARPFGRSEQHLLEALADYASIALVNARLFRMAEERARSFKQLADSARIGEKVNHEILRVVKKQLSALAAPALAELDQLSKDPAARWRADQRQSLSAIQERLLNIHQIAGAIAPPSPSKALSGPVKVNLVDLNGESLRRLQPYAQRAGLTFAPELSVEPVQVCVDSGLIAHVFDALIGNAIKYSVAGGKIGVRVDKTADQQAHVVVGNHSGRLLDARDIEKALASKAAPENGAEKTASFGGLGIRLGLVKEIVDSYQGKIWVESQSAKGIEVHIKLPLVR